MTPAELSAALAGLPGWEPRDEGRAIGRRFRFADFSEAWGFMTRVALAAEAMDHHPDWSNSYRTVDVALTTHTAGGVTKLDLDLAARIDALL